MGRMVSKMWTFFWLCLLAGLAACNEAPLPTAVPLASLPTNAPPTATTLPPTRDLAAVTGTAPPTSVPPTRPPTATPTPVNALVNITLPDPNAMIVMGSDVVVRGLMQLDESHSVTVALVSSTGHLLAEVAATVGDFGWEAALTIPQSVSGTAFLRATIRDQNGNVLAEDQVPVNLVLDAESSDRYLALFRPAGGETAVSGYTLFFDGRMLRPASNTFTVSVWADDCQNQVARQSFTVRSSQNTFYWQGFVVIPRNVSGPACAVAYFGNPGEENWREAQVPITILPPDEAEAKGVRIANPPPESEVTAGQELFLNGTALNVSEGEVRVSLLMENGRIVSQSIATTDYWGYWETSVTLPIDVEGRAEITASTGEDDTFAEAKTLITVVPAPES